MAGYFVIKNHVFKFGALAYVMHDEWTFPIVRHLIRHNANMRQAPAIAT